MTGGASHLPVLGLHEYESGWHGATTGEQTLLVPAAVQIPAPVNSVWISAVGQPETLGVQLPEVLGEHVPLDDSLQLWHTPSQAWSQHTPSAAHTPVAHSGVAVHASPGPSFLPQ